MTLPVPAKVGPVTDGNELLGKADALLAKYRGAPAPDFPVLTEVVELAPEPIAESAGRSDTVEMGTDAALELEMLELEARLRRQLLLSIEPYIANCLEAPLNALIKAQLDTALARAVDELAATIRAKTTTLVTNAVAEAVQQELAEFRARLRPP